MMSFIKQMFVLFIVSACLFTSSKALLGLKHLDKSKVTEMEIPLTRHKSLRHQLMEMGFNPSIIHDLIYSKIREPLTKNRYNGKPNPKPSDIKNTTVPIFKHLDAEYYGDILLGHPGQKLQVCLDTSWGDSFVPSVDCHTLSCKNHELYDADKSSTYVKKDYPGFNISWGGSEFIVGKLAEDLLHLGQINVTNYTFAQVTTLPNEFVTLTADGVLAMGFDGISNQTRPFFYYVMEQFVNMQKIFSFYFNNNPATKKSGSLLLGAVSDKHYNVSLGFHYFPVIGNQYWKISMQSANFNNPKLVLCAKGCNVVLDTGSSVILVPDADLKAINARTHAYKLDDNRFQFDCDKITNLPRIYFNFNGVTFSLKGKEYVHMIHVQSKEYCLSAFGLSSTNDWFFGGTFFYRHYVVFDMGQKRVGLARLL